MTHLPFSSGVPDSELQNLNGDFSLNCDLSSEELHHRILCGCDPNGGQP